MSPKFSSYLPLLIAFFWGNSSLIFAQKYELKEVIENDTISYILKNTHVCELTVTITEKQASPILIPETTYVIKPQDSVMGLVYIPVVFKDSIQDFESSNYFAMRLNFGRRIPQDSITDYRYELPFTKGKKYKVIQGFNGNFTHNKLTSRYAIDFKIPVGDTIVAARSGKIINTKDEFKEHGGAEFTKKANEIAIMHDDGTVAYYVHLDYKGIFVSVGERVEAGQPIGIAGWTGYSTTPHLHFVVRNLRESIPIKFHKYKRLGYKKGKWVRK